MTHCAKNGSVNSKPNRTKHPKVEQYSGDQISPVVSIRQFHERLQGAYLPLMIVREVVSERLFRRLFPDLGLFLFSFEKADLDLSLLK